MLNHMYVTKLSKLYLSFSDTYYKSPAASLVWSGGQTVCRHFKSWVCTASISITLQRIQFSSCTWLHMETYIGAVQRGAYLGFFLKIEKKEEEEKPLKKCEITHIDLQYSWVCTACISVSPQQIKFLLMHIERTYIGAVHQGLILIFLEKKMRNLRKKNWNYSYRLAIFVSLYGLYLRIP